MPTSRQGPDLASGLPPRRPATLLSDDPLPLVRPFEWHLQEVAHVAGLPLETVFRRAASLMQEVADPATWSQQAERRSTGESQLALIDHLAHRALRPMIARRAFFHLVAELVDN